MTNKTVTGLVTYGVKVSCPHCKKELHLNEFPYNDDSHDLSPAEDDLGLSLFGGAGKPAVWDNLDIEYTCLGCKNKFIIGKLEV